MDFEETYNAADFWQYGAFDLNSDEECYYGPFEFLRLEDIQGILREQEITIHMDELDVGDEPIFELKDGERVDAEIFTAMYKPMFAELGYDWDHVDNR